MAHPREKSSERRITSAIAAAAANLFGRIAPSGSDGVRRSVTYEPIGPIFAASPWNLPSR